MTPIHEGISQLIGHTPLMRLAALSPEGGATILGKLEYLNPGGSVKDRIALSMIEAAEATGQLGPGIAVVEATSGNTGIGLAMICAQRGYRLILTMPETMSFERRALVTRYGAEVVLTSGDRDMAGAVERAHEIVEDNPNCIELRQFENPANPEVHRRTTGPEILEGTNSQLAAFVAGVGTGGTITGAGEVIKAAVPGCQIVAVEPSSSPVLSGGKPGPHAIEGIGSGFIPAILNLDVIDQIITIDDRDAFDMTEELARRESLLVGISSGANVLAAREVAAGLGPQDTVVTILCDTGTRYFSVAEYFQRDSSSRPSSLL